MRSIKEKRDPTPINTPNPSPREPILKVLKVRKYIKFSLKKLKSISDTQRKLLLIGNDVLILIFSTYLAFVLRFDQLLPLNQIQEFKTGILVTIGLKLVLFYIFGLYRPLLRHSGLEMLEIILKVTLMTDGLVLFSSILFEDRLLPRSIQIILAFVALVLIINSRLTIRSLIWRTNDINLMSRTIRRQLPHWNAHQSSLKSTLIYGAGVTGYQVAQSIAIDQSANIIGFIDDNPSLQGRKLLHHKIFHSENIQTLVDEYQIQQILMAIPSASAKRKAAIIKTLQQYPVSIKTVPSAQDIVSGKISVTKLREIDIADLLGREEIPPNPQLLRANITNQTVMVTGAGGSIGSELCRQIAQLDPKKLILLDASEFALYTIDIELQEEFPHLTLIPQLGSVIDRPYLEKVFKAHQVDTIYHAAAYKHVPLVESNPAQGIINNTFGTMITAQTAQDCGVKTFVLISTDKAVRPTNVMGATKRAAELVLQALAAQSTAKTRFTMVRFGNVLGSSGSVVPRFRKQIAEGLPITLTHREITRYFMTIPEAARLVIQAGAMGKGGDVFLLDMGEPVKIYDLAVQIIKLSGLQLGRDIDIKITGLRPGEKLYEELLISGDNVTETEHAQIFSAREQMLPWKELEPHLNHLFESARTNDPKAIKKNLKNIVPEYQMDPQHSLSSEEKNALSP